MVQTVYGWCSQNDDLDIVEILDREYSYNAVATLITHSFWLKMILCTGQKFKTHRELNRHRTQSPNHNAVGLTAEIYSHVWKQNMKSRLENLGVLCWFFDRN